MADEPLSARFPSQYHILVVLHTDPDSEEPLYELEHPSQCALWIGYRDGTEFDRYFECEVTLEIDAVGAFEMLDGLEPGKYHVWHRVHRSVGLDWTEYDTEWQIEAVEE